MYLHVRNRELTCCKMSCTCTEYNQNAHCTCVQNKHVHAHAHVYTRTCTCFLLHVHDVHAEHLITTNVCGRVLTWNDVDVAILVFVDVDFSGIRRESDIRLQLLRQQHQGRE